MKIDISKQNLINLITDSYNIDEEKSSTLDDNTHTMMQLIKQANYDIDIINTVFNNDRMFFQSYIFEWNYQDYFNEPEYQKVIEQLRPEDALIFQKALPKYLKNF